MQRKQLKVTERKRGIGKFLTFAIISVLAGIIYRVYKALTRKALATPTDPPILITGGSVDIKFDHGHYKPEISIARRKHVAKSSKIIGVSIIDVRTRKTLCEYPIPSGGTIEVGVYCESNGGGVKDHQDITVQDIPAVSHGSVSVEFDADEFGGISPSTHHSDHYQIISVRVTHTDGGTTTELICTERSGKAFPRFTDFKGKRIRIDSKRK